MEQLDQDAQPVITISRGEKTLKSLPAAFRKDADFAELRSKAAHVKKQTNRVKRSLDEYGGVFKTIHGERLAVEVTFDHGVTTPLEVERLTIEKVIFSNQRTSKELPLAKVDPKLFSEVMRDLDLVVSVAHVGGVDPEASASTTKMRSRLVAETCKLLNIRNVDLTDTHAKSSGKLGDYTVHLGSGVVHRMPGGHVCIVPVHSLHRGRLFLPFADDDPRTAEVLSKTLLLARDDEIQDPIILQQLTAMG